MMLGSPPKSLPDAVADDGDLPGARNVVSGREIAPHHRAADSDVAEETIGNHGVPVLDVPAFLYVHLPAERLAGGGAVRG